MISVIIPALNEADLLPATLEHVLANKVSYEILVADGGSTDDTVKLAEATGARVVVSPQQQRGAQMNLGAKHARGDVFLFLHADTWITPTAVGEIEKALHDPRRVGGAFARRFRSESRVLRVTCLLGELRSRRLGWFLGDQGIFVRRFVFERLEGFHEIPLFEDLDFSRRLARTGGVVTLHPRVISSARRFDRRGAFVTTLSDVWLTARYLLGADPHRLGAYRSAKPPGKSPARPRSVE